MSLSLHMHTTHLSSRSNLASASQLRVCRPRAGVAVRLSKVSTSEGTCIMKENDHSSDTVSSRPFGLEEGEVASGYGATTYVSHFAPCAHSESSSLFQEWSLGRKAVRACLCLTVIMSSCVQVDVAASGKHIKENIMEARKDLFFCLTGVCTAVSDRHRCPKQFRRFARACSV